jgi:tetratricopeptide (TPR) repeat protein
MIGNELQEQAAGARAAPGGPWRRARGRQAMVVGRPYRRRFAILAGTLIWAASAGHAQVPPAPAIPAEDQLQSEADAREALMLDVRAYQRAIEDLELRDGAFSAGLSEQLLGLGLALQRNGDHQRAIEVFKRGVHIARINEGLYSQRQLSLLQGEIASHIALGSFEEADERQRYLYRVQAQTLSNQSRGQALMQHALWQRQAYEVGVDEEPFARLNRMWSLYRLALTEMVEVEGETSKALLPPLYGMLRAQYLLSGFVGEMSTGTFRTRNFYPGEDTSQMAYRGQSYQQGKAVIRAIYDVRTSQPDATGIDTIDTTMMLGDWSLWHGRRSEAMETYGKLYAELAQLENAQEVTTAVFGQPRPLPNFPGVRALPEPESGEQGHLLLEFGVTERGRVVDVMRLDENPLNDDVAEDVMRRLRQTPFRPRISDGLPVDTQGLRWAYDVSNW